jgi:hypothetical protein
LRTAVETVLETVAQAADLAADHALLIAELRNFLRFAGV